MLQECQLYRLRWLRIDDELVFDITLDEFDGSANEYLNAQHKLFRKRLVELYRNMGRILNLEDKEEQYRSLLNSFVQRTPWICFKTEKIRNKNSERFA